MNGKARRVGLTTAGRDVYEAHEEFADLAGHVISPGELFTRVGGGGTAWTKKAAKEPICRECRPFEVEGGAA